jgi:hypothetical protein
VAAFLVIVAFGVFLMLRRRHDRGRETILEPSEGFSSPVTPVVESIGGPLTPFMSSYEDTQPCKSCPRSRRNMILIMTLPNHDISRILAPPSRSSKNPRGRLRPQSDVGGVSHFARSVTREYLNIFFATSIHTPPTLFFSFGDFRPASVCGFRPTSGKYRVHKHP